MGAIWRPRSSTVGETVEQVPRIRLKRSNVVSEGIPISIYGIRRESFFQYVLF
jgi:hypothetical protein